MLQSNAGLHTSGPLLLEHATSICRAMAGQWSGARQQAPQVLAALQDRAAGWSQEDVTKLASLGACNIGHRGGHNFLKSWRGGAGDPVDQDLTDGEVFDWFAYLGKHPNGNMIFNGARIVAFTIAKLASMDSNTKQHRVDFCILRNDGTMVRLHPSICRETFPVECDDPSAVLLAGNRPREVRIDRRTYDGGKGDGKGRSLLHRTDCTEEKSYQQVTTVGFRRPTPCQSAECRSIWMTEPATGSSTRQGSLSRWTSQEALPLISKSHGTCILQTNLHYRA